KRWIGGQLEARGTLYVDAGAEKALGSGKSLLVAGVTRVEGNFERGDAVMIRSADGRELGRGLASYAKADAFRILGRKSSEIAEILGFEGGPELIHRNDMSLRKEKRGETKPGIDPASGKYQVATMQKATDSDESTAQLLGGIGTAARDGARA